MLLAKLGSLSRSIARSALARVGHHTSVGFIFLTAAKWLTWVRVVPNTAINIYRFNCVQNKNEYIKDAFKPLFH